jgi:hypothetical protein
MSNTVMDLLQRKLKEQEDSHIQALAEGAVNDYASYRELCGVIRGLQTAQREIGDLVRKLKVEDDD